MALRDILESDSFRHGRAIPAAVALVVAVVAWFGIQNLLFGGNSEVAPAPPVVQQPQPVAAPQPAASGVTVRQAPPPAVAEPPVFPRVLVTQRNIESGVMLTSALVEWREWREPIDLNMAVLQDTVPLQAILGSVTRQRYVPGTPIGWDGIIMQGGPGFIGAVLAPGMRAVTVEVDRATTSANIIYPGDRVDVIMVSTSDGALAASQAIVRDARVLAVGSTTYSQSRYGRVSLTKAGAIEPVAPPAGENYTLEVLPVDAERIALAVTAGRLTLAMRSVSAAPAYDRETPRPVRMSEVMIEPVVPPPPPGAPPIRIIRGSAGEEIVPMGS